MGIKVPRTFSAVSLGAASLLAASTASAFDFKVNETNVDIYGYAKLDVIYDVDADLNNAIIRSNIRMDGEPGVDGHTTLSANQSRLGLTTTTMIGGEPLKTNIEGDFYGAGGFTGGGGEFRLRHAYGEWNGILAGQTWSNFGNVLSYFPTVDFNGLLATGGGRQAQLRYTTGNFSVSLEDPKVGGSASAEGSNQYRIPDITARYQASAGGVNFAVAGLARFLEYDAEGSSVSNPNWSDDSATGWGVTVEANTKLTDTITVRGSLTHGDGIGGYLYLTPATQPGYVDDQGNLETIESTGGGVSLSVAAGPGSVNLGYGLTIADLDDAFAQGAVQGSADERYSSAFVNYIWSPYEQITYGLEAGYHTAEQVNGEDGDAARLHAMVMFGF